MDIPGSRSFLSSRFMPSPSRVRESRGQGKARSAFHSLLHSKRSNSNTLCSSNNNNSSSDNTRMHPITSNSSSDDGSKYLLYKEPLASQNDFGANLDAKRAKGVKNATLENFEIPSFLREELLLVSDQENKREGFGGISDILGPDGAQHLSAGQQQTLQHQRHRTHMQKHELEQRISRLREVRRASSRNPSSSSSSYMYNEGHAAVLSANRRITEATADAHAEVAAAAAYATEGGDLVAMNAASDEQCQSSDAQQDPATVINSQPTEIHRPFQKVQVTLGVSGARPVSRSPPRRSDKGAIEYLSPSVTARRSNHTEGRVGGLHSAHDDEDNTASFLRATQSTAAKVELKSSTKVVASTARHALRQRTPTKATVASPSTALNENLNVKEHADEKRSQPTTARSKLDTPRCFGARDDQLQTRSSSDSAGMRRSSSRGASTTYSLRSRLVESKNENLPGRNNVSVGLTRTLKSPRVTRVQHRQEQQPPLFTFSEEQQSISIEQHKELNSLVVEEKREDCEKTSTHRIQSIEVNQRSRSTHNTESRISSSPAQRGEDEEKKNLVVGPSDVEKNRKMKAEEGQHGGHQADNQGQSEDRVEDDLHDFLISSSAATNPTRAASTDRPPEASTTENENNEEERTERTHDFFFFSEPISTRSVRNEIERENNHNMGENNDNKEEEGKNTNKEGDMEDHLSSDEIEESVSLSPESAAVAGNVENFQTVEEEEEEATAIGRNAALVESHLHLNSRVVLNTTYESASSESAAHPNHFDIPLQRPTMCFYNHTHLASPYRIRYPQTTRSSSTGVQDRVAVDSLCLRATASLSSPRARSSDYCDGFARRDAGERVTTTSNYGKQESFLFSPTSPTNPNPTLRKKLLPLTSSAPSSSSPSSSHVHVPVLAQPQLYGRYGLLSGIPTAYFGGVEGHNGYAQAGEGSVQNLVMPSRKAPNNAVNAVSASHNHNIGASSIFGISYDDNGATHDELLMPSHGPSPSHSMTTPLETFLSKDRKERAEKEEDLFSTTETTQKGSENCVRGSSSPPRPSPSSSLATEGPLRSKEPSSSSPRESLHPSCGTRSNVANALDSHNSLTYSKARIAASYFRSLEDKKQRLAATAAAKEVRSVVENEEKISRQEDLHEAESLAFHSLFTDYFKMSSDLLSRCAAERDAARAQAETLARELHEAKTQNNELRNHIEFVNIQSQEHAIRTVLEVQSHTMNPLHTSSHISPCAHGKSLAEHEATDESEEKSTEEEKDIEQNEEEEASVGSKVGEEGDGHTCTFSSSFSHALARMLVEANQRVAELTEAQERSEVEHAESLAALKDNIVSLESTLEEQIEQFARESKDVEEAHATAMAAQKDEYEQRLQNIVSDAESRIEALRESHAESLKAEGESEKRDDEALRDSKKKINRLETQRAWLVSVICSMSDHENRLRESFRRWQEWSCRPVLVTKKQREDIASASETAVTVAIGVQNERHQRQISKIIEASLIEREALEQTIDSERRASSTVSASKDEQIRLLRAQLDSLEDDMHRAREVLAAQRVARASLEAQLSASSTLNAAMSDQIATLMENPPVSSTERRFGSEEEPNNQQQRQRPSIATKDEISKDSGAKCGHGTSAAGNLRPTTPAHSRLREGQLLPHQLRQQQQQQQQQIGKEKPLPSAGPNGSRTKNATDISSCSVGSTPRANTPSDLEDQVKALKWMIVKERRHCFKLSSSLASHQSVLRESSEAYAELLQHAELWFQQLYFLKRYCEEVKKITIPSELATDPEEVIRIEAERASIEEAVRAERRKAAHLLQCPAIEDVEGEGESVDQRRRVSLSLSNITAAARAPPENTKKESAAAAISTPASSSSSSSSSSLSCAKAPAAVTGSAATETRRDDTTATTVRSTSDCDAQGSKRQQEEESDVVVVAAAVATKEPTASLTHQPKEKVANGNGVPQNQQQQQAPKTNRTTIPFTVVLTDSDDDESDEKGLRNASNGGVGASFSDSYVSAKPANASSSIPLEVNSSALIGNKSKKVNDDRVIVDDDDGLDLEEILGANNTAHQQNNKTSNNNSNSDAPPQLVREPKNSESEDVKSVATNTGAAAAAAPFSHVLNNVHVEDRVGDEKEVSLPTRGSPPVDGHNTNSTSARIDHLPAVAAPPPTLEEVPLTFAQRLAAIQNASSTSAAAVAVNRARASTLTDLAPPKVFSSVAKKTQPPTVVELGSEAGKGQNNPSNLSEPKETQQSLKDVDASSSRVRAGSVAAMLALFEGK